MGEEEAESTIELVDDSPSEALGELQPTNIVSKYNTKNDLKMEESSKTRNYKFLLERQKFLKECHEKGIFLEGLITSVFMDDSDLIDVFESGIAKAANFSELGDIQMVTGVVAQWCMKLHTKSGKKRSQKVAWFKENGLKETKLKEIDKQLRARYTEVVALVSDLKTPTLLNVNKNVQLVHETMVELMAKLWFHRLCIYQGHKDLGYMQISSKVPSLIGKKSCYRLTNEPPRFVLALDALTKDCIPEEVNVLVCIEEDLVASILSKYHNTKPEDIVDQFFYIPVVTEYMSFELGSLASSDKFCERLKLICGKVIKVIYDRDLKQLKVLCPKVGCDSVKSVLVTELNSLKMELEKKELEIPYPTLHSPLRIQVGEGLQCFGIIGCQWFHGKQLQEVHIRKCTCTSESSEAGEISPTHEEDSSCMCKSNLEDLYSYQNVSANDNAVEYEHYTESLIAKQKNISDDDVVVFDSSVDVILNCLIRDEVACEENGNVSMSFGEAKTIIIAGVIRGLAEVGLRTDGGENSTAISTQASSESPNQFEIKIVFPNVYAARAGVRCLEGISGSMFSVCLKHPTELAAELKTIRIMMTPGFHQVAEKPLQELLDRMQDDNVIDRWLVQDSLSSLSHSNINRRMFVSVTATDNCHMHSLTQILENFFQPAKVTIDNLQLHYLHSNDGAKFLKFLMFLTKTCIYLPEFHKTAYIYGDHLNKNESARILKRQLDGKPDSCGLNWYLFDFEDTCFNSSALMILYRNMRSHLDKFKCSKDISQYYLFENRPELWLETKADIFSKYSEEIKSTRIKQMDLVKSPSQELMCPICFCENLEASSKDCYLLSVCGHAYCKGCLLQLVIQSTKDRKLPIKCAFRKCDKVLSVAELWYICGVVQYYDIRKALRGVLKSFVAENAPSFGLCLRKRCGAMCVVYERDKIKVCLWCQSRFCLQCDSKFHGTTACDEAWNANSWLKEDKLNRRRCPNCRIAIQKEYGCDAVFCVWCKKYICWTCGKFHAKTSSACYLHISSCRAPAR